MQLSGKKILVGVTGSIAAYKSIELCRLLIKEGAAVRVIMTPSALDFVTPLTFSAITGFPVYHSMISDENWNNHVEAGLWADLYLIAPASANTIAALSAGICNNMLLAVYLSARCPVMIAPAMDHDMYHHIATKNNIKTLESRGHRIIGPASGALASGLTGDGRLEEPATLLEAVRDFFLNSGDLKGKKVLVTAGPTREAIDAVRYISNRSSGKMGFAIAEEIIKRGGQVTLVAGPNHLEAPQGSDYIKVETAGEMYRACQSAFETADIAVMTAAVSDFAPDAPSELKIKKTEMTPMLALRPTIDILAELGKIKKKHQILVGFALETNDGLPSAKDKLERKNLDMIVLNTLADKGAGFDTETNKVTLIDRKEIIKGTLKSKSAVAKDIVDRIISMSHA